MDDIFDRDILNKLNNKVHTQAKQIEILKGMIVESQMAKLCWCDKCCDKGRSAKKEREKLFRELDALVIVKDLQNVKSTKKE